MAKAMAKVSKPAKPKPATQPPPASLTVSSQQEVADTLIMPSVHAALTIKEYTKGVGSAELKQTIIALRKTNADLASGDLGRLEATLLMQAQTLDVIFHHLARRAERSEWVSTMEAYLRLGLKAQSQCRATLQTLAEIKNPPHIAFVRQANIANGPQQVNNGQSVTAEPPSPRAKETQNAPNGLLSEGPHAANLDTRTARRTGGKNRELAPMEQINRAEN